MDFERRMDFIVENLAALTVSQQTLAASQKALAASQEKTDRQMRGLQTLVKTGMRMLIEVQRAQKRTDQALAELAEAQKRTDDKFERWLRSLNKGTNGHKKKPN